MCLSFQPLQADSLSCSFQEQLLSSSHLPKYLHLEQIILLVDMFLHRLPFPLCTWLTSRKRLKKPHPPRSLSCQYMSQVHRWVQGVYTADLGNQMVRILQEQKCKYLPQKAIWFFSFNEIETNSPQALLSWPNLPKQRLREKTKLNMTKFLSLEDSPACSKEGLETSPPSAYAQNLI